MNSQDIATIAACLTASVILGWSLPDRWRMPAVCTCGAAMMGIVSPTSLLFLLVASCAAISVTRSGSRTLLTPIFIMTVALGYGFLLVLNSWGDTLAVGHWVLPFAMAYSSLRLIHYVLEADRGNLPSHGWREAAMYQFFPPSLAVGPINRFGDFHRDLRRRRWDAEQFSMGLTRILFGAAKVVVLGNFIIAEILGYRLYRLDGMTGWYFRQIGFWLNLYVQFSGYTDVAIGFGALLGFRLPENFRYPFLASNIGDFWRRWHITLANWCRDYVYLPVLARWRSPRLAMTASMLTIGLWHEASARYVLWGLYHASGLNIWRAFQKRYYYAYERQTPTVRHAWTVLAWLLTVHFVIFSYAITTWVDQKVRGL
jgi:D-alanyl-lipoteichoic acid acyltransferase DltB (MBOAT superfamily)